MLQRGAGDRGANGIIALGSINGFPQNSRAGFDRRGEPISPVEREVSMLEVVSFALANAWLQPANSHDGPSPEYVREPEAPRRVRGLIRHDSDRSLTSSFRALR